MNGSDDPFAILGVPRRFAIDRAALRSARLRRLAGGHPDRIADPVERAEAVRQAARINEAHAALEDEERRANVLLALMGGPAKEDDRSLPEGFLVEMMETRERIEDMLSGGDPGAVQEVEAWADERRAEALARVAALFERAEGAGTDDDRRAALVAIRGELNAWRYIERLRDELRRGAPGARGFDGP